MELTHPRSPPASAVDPVADRPNWLPMVSMESRASALANRLADGSDGSHDGYARGRCWDVQAKDGRTVLGRLPSHFATAYGTGAHSTRSGRSSSPYLSAICAPPPHLTPLCSDCPPVPLEHVFSDAALDDEGGLIEALSSRLARAYRWRAVERFGPRVPVITDR
jgi:hypothetical protein